MTNTRCFGAFIVVGPGDEESRRAKDTLESLCCLEPSLARIAIIEDSPVMRPALLPANLPVGCELIHEPHPAAGIGGGLRGRLTVGVLSAMRHFDSDRYAFCVKLDTDALVIRPFSDALMEFHRIAPSVGIVGDYGTDIHGVSSNWGGWGRTVRNLARPIRLYRNPPQRWRHVQSALWGAQRRVRRWTQRAFQRGYFPGEGCLGGSYAVMQPFLRAAATARVFEQRLDWLNTNPTEDVVMGIVNRALGLYFGRHCGDGKVFGITHTGLPDSPEGLWKRRVSIIHSVKNDPTFSEDAIRRFFRQKRTSRSTEYDH